MTCIEKKNGLTIILNSDDKKYRLVVRISLSEDGSCWQTKMDFVHFAPKPTLMDRSVASKEPVFQSLLDKSVAFEQDFLRRQQNAN
jgi:hypothetical protein